MEQRLAANRATKANKCVVTETIDRLRKNSDASVVNTDIPSTSSERTQRAATEKPTESLKEEPEIPLYLAYGSNLSNETFLGKRGIKPLSAINVLVPSLRMTFDLPGLPYSEPCFANSARRDASKDAERSKRSTKSEKSGIKEGESLQSSDEKRSYRKDMWKKGMVGVVYEVTAKDYAHIIATEGGGSSYQDILVDCYTLSADQTKPVPWVSDSKPFQAHTLFAPAVPERDAPSDGGRIRRPDPSYAQASARYLKLITDGAEERKLPFEYQNYLHSLRPYTATTQGQRLGEFVFMMLFLPFVLFVFSLNRKYSDDRGVAPKWLRQLTEALFSGVWMSYDDFFFGIFGDGERTIEKDDEEDQLLSKRFDHDNQDALLPVSTRSSDRAVNAIEPKAQSATAR